MFRMSGSRRSNKQLGIWSRKIGYLKLIGKEKPSHSSLSNMKKCGQSATLLKSVDAFISSYFKYDTEGYESG